MKNTRKRGSVLMLSMFLLAVIMLLAGIFLDQTVLNVMLIQNDLDYQRAEWIARAGISQEIYNLREYWYLHQQEVLQNQNFGNGIFTVGVATLIGRGFHNALVLAVGQYPANAGYAAGADTSDDTDTSTSTTTDTTQVKQVCEAAEVSMNSPADFLNYINPEGNTMDLVYTMNGPIHINGDANYGSSWQSGAFNKSQDDYGPVLSIGGHFYFVNNGNYPSTNMFGEGTYNGQTYTATTEVTIKNAGIPAWQYGAYNYDMYPTDVTHTSPDGTTFTYKLLDDASCGSVFFNNIPSSSEYNWDNFQYLADPSWHITKANPCGCNLAYRDNECIGAGNGPSGNSLYRPNPYGQMVTVGPCPFDYPNFTVQMPDGRDMKYVRYLYMDSRDPNLAHEDSGAWGLGVGQWYGTTPGPNYVVNRQSNSITVSYEMQWNNYRFPYPPGSMGAPGGRIRGFNRRQEGHSLAANTPSTQITHTINQSGAFETWSTLSTVDPDVGGGAPQVVVQVWNGANGSTWSEVSTTTLSTALPTAQEYALDPNSGTFMFGNGINGASIPPTGPGNPLLDPNNPTSYYNVSITYSYTRDFITSYMYLDLDAITATQCAELDLGTINAQNAPRDPKYPDDPTKYGVIYSELPMIVWGVPQVPVTIVTPCDVYVGPINWDYLDPNNVDNVTTTKHFNFTYDDPRCNPVGILCGGVLWEDNTFACWDGTTSLKSVNNIGVPDGALKNWTVNRVFTGAGFIYPYNLGNSYYGSDAEELATGQATRLSYHWTLAQPGYWFYGGCGTRIGSLYQDFDKTAQTAATTENIFRCYDQGGNGYPNSYYTSSFRTNPPPHIPNYIYLTNWTRIDDVDSANQYLTLLGTLIQSNGGSTTNMAYTPEFASILDQMLQNVEK